MIDLAETLLAADPDVLLVDRHQVAELLAEQDLSRLGAVQEQHAMRVGRVLAASVFAVLEAVEKDGAPWAASIFDARTGEVLATSTLASQSDVSAMAEAFAGTVRDGLGKYAVPRDDRKPVAVMAVRNVDLGGMWDTWCMGIERLLEQAILDAPGATLLNRRHLEWVNRETDLQRVAAELTGSVLRLSLEVRRGEPGGAWLAMRVEDGVGNVLTEHHAASEEMDAAALARNLANAFRSWLENSEVETPLPADPLAEAERYMADAEYFKAHVSSGGYQGAFGAAEAALALAPLDDGIRNRAINVLMMLGSDNRPSDLHAIWRCIEISKQHHLRSIHKQETLQGYLTSRVNPIADMLFHLQMRARNIDDHDRVILEKAIDETRRRLEDWALGTVMEYYYAGMAPPPQETVQWNIMNLLPRMHWFPPDSQAWRLVTEGYPLLLDELEEHPVIHPGTIRIYSRHFARLAVMATGQRQMERTGSEPGSGLYLYFEFKSSFVPSDAHRRTMRPLFERMVQHGDPVVSAYGLLGQLALDRSQEGLDDTVILERMLLIRERLRQDMLAPGREPHERYREAAYGAERDMIDLFVEDPEDREQWHQELFAFMIENRHLDFWTSLAAVHPNAMRFRHYHPPRGTADTNYVGYEIDFFKHEIIPRPESDYPLLLARARQILYLHEQGGFVGSGLQWYSAGYPPFDRHIASVIHELYAKRPDLREVPALAWKRAEPLHSYKDGQDQILAIAGIRDQALFTVARENESSNSSYVLKIPLDGSSPQRWGRPFDWETHPNQHSHAAFGGSGGLFFVTGDAFVHFPSDRDEPILWTPESGYPADKVAAVGEVNGTLIIALERSYVFGRRPADSTWQLISSARRTANPDSKLDGIPYRVQRIVPDPQQDRILLVVGSAHPSDLSQRIDGVWAIHAQTLELAQKFGIPRYVMNSSVAGDGRIAIQFSRMTDRNLDQFTFRGIVVFDPSTGTSRLTHALGNERGGLGPGISHTPETRPFVSTGTIGLVGQRLWAGNYIVLEDGKVELLPPLPDGSALLHDHRTTHLPVPSTSAVVAARIMNSPLQGPVSLHGADSAVVHVMDPKAEMYILELEE